MKKYLILLFCFLSIGMVAQVDSNEEMEGMELSEEEQQLMNEALAAIFSGGQVDVKDSYTFDFEYTIKMKESSVLKDSPEQNITMRFNEDEKLMNMEMTNLEGQEARVQVIFNYDSKEMITMTDQGDQKIGFAMKIPDLSEIISEEITEEEDEEERAELTDTGRTESILGYICDIKELKEGDTTHTFWVAQDKNAIPTSAFSAFTEMNGQKAKSQWMKDNECILKMTEKSADGETSFSFEVTEIKGNVEVSVSTIAYSFENLFGQ